MKEEEELDLVFFHAVLIEQGVKAMMEAASSPDLDHERRAPR